MNRILLIFIFLLFTQTDLKAQNFKIKGRLLNSTDSTAVVGTTVMTPEGKVNTMCNENGDFSFAYLPSGTTELMCIMLGFDNLMIPVTSATKVDLGNLYMQEQRNAIEEVVITAEAPIAVQKGDTTQFNAASFKTNPDADADELVMKMPGVIIQDGKIEAQGEQIKKIYVDGELFFGTDPMEALKSLPANAIESIQLFDELSEQAKITGIEDTDPVKAINIVTKSKSNKNTMLKLEASGGIGTEDPNRFHYLSGGNVSYFNKNTRITVTGITNNVNMSRYGEDESADVDDVDSDGNVEGLTQGIKTTNGIGVNFSHKKEDKVRLSSSYFFNSTDNPIEKVNERDYYAVDGVYDTKNITTQTSSTSMKYSHRFYFRLELKPNESNTLIINPRVSFQNGESFGQGRSATIQDGDSVNRVVSYTGTKYQYLNFSGTVLYAHRFKSKKGRNISANFSYDISDKVTERYQRETSRETYNSTTQIWTAKDEEDLTNRVINQDVESKSLNLKLSYVEPFGTRHKLSVSALANKNMGGTDKTNDKYNYETSDYDIADTAQYSLFDRSYDALGLGAGYGYHSKTLDINVGADWLSQFQEYDQDLPYDAETIMDFKELRPYFSFKYRVDKKRYFRLFYRGQTILPDLGQMQNVIDDEYTTNISIGNPDLESSYKHSMFSYFNISNIEKSTNLTLAFSGSVINNVITSQVEVMPADTVIYTTESDRLNGVNGYEPVEGAFLTKKINLDRYLSAKFWATYSFVARPIKSNINVSLSYSYIRSPSYYYALNYANIHAASFRVGLSSNISENVDFNISSNTVVNRTLNTYLANSSFINQNLYLTSNFIFLNDFVLNTSLTWRYYESQGSYLLCNLGLGKKVFKQNTGEFRITVYDLLDQNRNIMHYTRNTSEETINSNTIGRYVLLKFGYRFNTMSNPRKNKLPDGQNVREITVDQLKEKTLNRERSKK